MATFLMFRGDAEQAMDMYVLLFGGTVGQVREVGWCNDRFGVSWELNVP